MKLSALIPLSSLLLAGLAYGESVSTTATTKTTSTETEAKEAATGLSTAYVEARLKSIR